MTPLPTGTVKHLNVVIPYFREDNYDSGYIHTTLISRVSISCSACIILTQYNIGKDF